MAEQSEALFLYQQSVQAPEVEVDFLSRIYRDVFGASPSRLREDFCGAAAVACAWVASAPDREAWGVDLDGPTLAWGMDNNVSVLPEAARERIHLVEGDVRTAEVPPVDLICAENFSYFVFQTRDELRGYFARCWRGLFEKGVLVVDLFGGYESLEDDREETTEHAGFDYVWEQHRYDPINAHGIYKIHFRFPDGSELEDAFVYDWRLWTIPEVREVMLEAGFDRVDVYWEEEDPRTGYGTGRYSVKTSGESDPAWDAYVIGIKSGS